MPISLPEGRPLVQFCHMNYVNIDTGYLTYQARGLATA